MTTRALFTVNDVLDRKDAAGNQTAQIVKMNPSYISNPDNPNHAFWKATPTGSLEMTIGNPDAFGFFVPGQSYWLDFTPMESAPK